jgi:hypothetical protein
MRQPPSERDRAISTWREKGLTLRAVAEEFGISAEVVRRIIWRVESYDRGMALLREDPTSLRGLELVGKISGTIRYQLEFNGVTKLTDLDGFTEKELLRWPMFGRRAVQTLFSLLHEHKKVMDNVR